jgi:hypothetical protein
MAKIGTTQEEKMDICLSLPQMVSNSLILVFVFPHCTKKGKFGIFLLSLHHNSIKFLMADNILDLRVILTAA